MKFPKIIIFFPSIEKGGADKNLSMILNFLAKKRNQISLVTSTKINNKIYNSNIKYIGPQSKFINKFGRSIKTIISLIYLFKSILFKKNLIVFSFQSNLYAILLCKLLCVKIITRSNSFPNDWTKNFIKKIIFGKVYKLADLTIVNSYKIKKKFNKYYKINPVHIYNPVDKKKILHLSNLGSKKIFKKDRGLKIISVGRLSEEKDHFTLLKSLKIIKNRIKFEAIILGSGKLKSQLIKKIKSYRLKKNVKLIDYKLNPYPYIKQSDFLILSSIHEGLPNVLIEAIILKKFVISSNCETGPNEILLNGKAGCLFKVKKPNDLANKILFYYKNKKLRNKMIKNAINSSSRFDYKFNLQKYYELLQNA